MKLEDIILSEIGQTQGQTHSGFHLDEVLRSARAETGRTAVSGAGRAREWLGSQC